MRTPINLSRTTRHSARTMYRHRYIIARCIIRNEDNPMTTVWETHLRKTGNVHTVLQVCAQGNGLRSLGVKKSQGNRGRQRTGRYIYNIITWLTSSRRGLSVGDKGRAFRLENSDLQMLTTLPLTMFQPQQDQRTSHSQSGFRPRRGCIDQN